LTLNPSSTEFQESLASCVSCYRWFCNSIQIANFLSQSLYSIPRFRRADLRLNLHLHLLLSGSYKYLHQDFAMKVVSRGSFIRWCCCGKKMAVYFKYFCAGNYCFSWEYLSSKGVSAHIALTFTLFHTRVRAMRSYLTRYELCSDVIDRIRSFAIKPFVDCFSLQAVVHSQGRDRGMFLFNNLVFIAR